MALIDATLLDEASLRSMSSAWKKSIETLDEMGWIEKEEITLDDKVYIQAPIPSLNDEQKKHSMKFQKQIKLLQLGCFMALQEAAKPKSIFV